MHVRWRKRPRIQNKQPTGEYTLSAILFEGGRGTQKRQQRKVAQLGSIGSNRVGMYYHQAKFWIAAQAKLATLALTPSEQYALEKSLEAVVPKPSRDGLAQELSAHRKKEDQLRGDTE